MKTQAKKRNRSGERGIRNVDKVQDVDLFVDQYKDEDGRIVRLGKIRLSHEINNSLKTIAHELKISKAGLVRALFVGFIKHYKDSKATGANKHFTPESTIQGWLNAYWLVICDVLSKLETFSYSFNYASNSYDNCKKIRKTYY